MPVTVTVAKAASLTGLSPHTIRYYLREDLLPTVRQDQNGVHLFTRQDLLYLYCIEFLKACGLSIQEIRTFARFYEEGNATLNDRLALLQDKPAELEGRLRELRHQLALSRYMVWFYRQAAETGSMPVLEGDPFLNFLPPPFPRENDAPEEPLPWPEEHRPALAEMQKICRKARRALSLEDRERCRTCAARDSCGEA